MKCRVYSAAVAVGVLALAGYSQGVRADTFTVQIMQDSGSAPAEGDAAPNGTPPSIGSFTTGVTGSVPLQYLSPYAGNPALENTQPYNVISADHTGPGSATYNLNGANFFDILWGSPDTYNEIEFFSAANGGGVPISLLYTGDVSGPGNTEVGPVLNGGQLTCFTGGQCTDTGYALVQFIDTNSGIGSVVLSDTQGSAAFEFGTTGNTTELETPLPGALALFAGGLGLIGFVGRRRRKTSGGHRLSIPGMA